MQIKYYYFSKNVMNPNKLDLSQPDFRRDLQCKLSQKAKMMEPRSKSQPKSNKYQEFHNTVRNEISIDLKIYKSIQRTIENNNDNNTMKRIETEMENNKYQ